MLTKTTHLDAIQFEGTGTLLIRLRKRTSLDGEVLKEDWHRTSIPPGESVEMQMAAVNDHLHSMGFDQLPAEEVATIAAMANVHHTPAVVAAYRARLRRTGGDD
ncbi:MAG: hypothetical protein KIS96_11010 [Bauldia sp.]|nr:hypothetical protein [Bauldia sp.]